VGSLSRVTTITIHGPHGGVRTSELANKFGIQRVLGSIQTATIDIDISLRYLWYLLSLG
jgi:hypothetical protein